MDGVKLRKIDTAKDWWDAVYDNWDDLLTIIGDQMMLDSPAYDTPGKSESSKTGRNVLNEVIYLKDNKDNKLARYFSAGWCLASEAYAWSVDGWGLLCDLCSEEYVLYGEQDDY